MPRRQPRRTASALSFSVALAGSLGAWEAVRAGFVQPPSGSLGSARQLPLAAGAAAVAETALGWAAPAEATLPAAPSGVNVLPETQQAAVVLAIFAGIGLGVWGVVSIGFQALRALLPEGWFDGWQRTWPIIGAFYVAAGSAHFSAQEAFEAIYPPDGTWGFWHLPGSASFHVAWTGVAEVAGGVGLFVGSIALALAGAMGIEPPKLLRQLPAAAALGLFLLTWAVTPANIYMYTHGAQMIGLTPGDQPIPVEFHALRGTLQVILLSLLWGYYGSSWAEAQRE